jgi:hypothetical protein
MPDINLTSDWHRLGGEFSVRFTFQGQQLGGEWAPRLPTRREFERMADSYRDARHLFLTALAQRLGGLVVCVEA